MIRVRWLRAAGVLYALLLRSYPRRFRSRYGAELRRVFDDTARDAWARGGTRRALSHVAGACVDAVRSGLAERLARPTPLPPERHRDTVRFRMETMIRDVRLALRGLSRTPAFAAIAVLTIALGIGANTAIFSVVRGVLLRPLPYESPDRLVLLWGEMTRRGVRDFPSSPPDFQDFQRMATQLETLAGIFTFQQPLIADEGAAMQVMTAGVTPEFMGVLGLTPMLGRGFTEEDGRPGPNDQPNLPSSLTTAAILDHGFWRERFGGDPAVVGRIVRIAGGPAEIVGVMPPDVRLHLPATAGIAPSVDVWVAPRIDYDNAPRNNVFLRVIGRLAPGATVATAQAEMDRISAEMRSQYPLKEGSGFGMRVEPLHEDLVRPVRPIILALMGAVGFVLLIACANVANLLLVRAVGRERELAVRASMGGTRGRLVRQLLAEGAVLGTLGALGGVLLAALGVRAVLAIAPADLPRLDAVSIDGAVLAFTALATLAAVAVFGIVPALRAARPNLMDILREGGRNPGLGAGRALRNAVVVAEVALSLVLLVGAGLMLRSFDALRHVDPGWDAGGVLAFDTSLPFASYPESRRRTQFALQLQERLRAVPGIETASAAFPAPFANVAFNGRWGTEEALTDPDAFRQADYVVVMPGYFEAMRTELLAGRAFEIGDVTDSAAVVVIDETLARNAFGSEPAVGKDIFVRVTSNEPQRVRVIGVIRPQRRSSLIEAEREAVYFTDLFAGGFGAYTWVVRTHGPDPRAALDAIRGVLRTVDAEVPLANVRMLQADVNRAMAPTRFALVLIGAFAGIALLLAAVGLYGVLSFAVRQRTAEIGVRVAFGAPRGRILRLIVGQGLALSGAGIVLGLVAAAALTRLIESMLVGVTPTDPGTFATIGAIFLGVAAFASWLPARRAASIDPVRALREE